MLILFFLWNTFSLAQIDISEMSTQKISEPLYPQPVKSVTSGLQLQITKVPGKYRMLFVACVLPRVLLVLG